MKHAVEGRNVTQKQDFWYDIMCSISTFCM